MPRLIDAGSDDAIALDDLIEALATRPIDPRDEDAFASLGPLLARLGRNRTFLADLAIDELKTRCTGQTTLGAYGPQVFLLRPPTGRYVLRANFWPSRGDAAMRASGAAAFFYDMPHDHNFSFLTYGYLGPGYWSDYYEYDPDALVGLPGEDVELRFIGRQRLEPDMLMLYRMRRDIHVQLPPDRFSVSLNILGSDPAQPWVEQFRFDVARGTIAENLTTTGAETLVALAVHAANGLDLAERFALHHPCDRMRVTAIDALASAQPTMADSLWDRASRDSSAYVAGYAARRRTARDAQAAP
ncbi:transposase [Sphingomonas sp. RS6]